MQQCILLKNVARIRKNIQNTWPGNRKIYSNKTTNNTLVSIPLVCNRADESRFAVWIYGTCSLVFKRMLRCWLHLTNRNRSILQYAHQRAMQYIIRLKMSRRVRHSFVYIKSSENLICSFKRVKSTHGTERLISRKLWRWNGKLNHLN